MTNTVPTPSYRRWDYVFVFIPCTPHVFVFFKSYMRIRVPLFPSFQWSAYKSCHGLGWVHSGDTTGVPVVAMDGFLPFYGVGPVRRFYPLLSTGPSVALRRPARTPTRRRTPGPHSHEKKGARPSPQREEVRPPHTPTRRRRRTERAHRVPNVLVVSDAN